MASWRKERWGPDFRSGAAKGVDKEHKKWQEKEKKKRIEEYKKKLGFKGKRTKALSGADCDCERDPGGQADAIAVLVL